MTTSVTADQFETEVLRRHWIQLPASDAAAAAELRERVGVDFSVAAAKGRVWESDNFIYLPVVVNFKRGDTIEREAIMFALGPFSA